MEFSDLLVCIWPEIEVINSTSVVSVLERLVNPNLINVAD